MELGNANKNNLVNRHEENKYYIDDYKISAENTNDSHSLIATRIKPNSVVLDVGCAQGIIGTYLNKEKKCKVYGIEIDNVSRKIAESKKSYKELFGFSVTDKKDKKYIDFFNKKIKFDYIIFADILEHLIDPADVIYEFQKLLKDDGKIIISLPNISHFDIIHGLMNDKFNYSKLGLLDNTHIRFFTANSFIEMINEINEYYDICLNVKRIATTHLEPEYSSEYASLYVFLNETQSVDILQNIFEIKKGKTKKNKIINDIDLCSKLNSICDDNIRLQQENEILHKQLDRIKNTKIYKILKKIYHIFK